MKYTPFRLRKTCQLCSLVLASVFGLLTTNQLAVARIQQEPALIDHFVQLDPREAAAGWISLFDGQSLMGWKAESEADWHVQDKAILVTSGQPGLLRTTSQFSDFELRLEFLADPDTNSGIFVRTSAKPNSPIDGCYEINLIRPGLHDFPTGSIVGRAAGESPAHPDGKTWHSMRIVADGARIIVEVDNTQVVDFTDENPLGRGYIGLQLNSGRVGFRNIRLRPLGLQKLIDGDKLDQWDSAKLGSAKMEYSVNEPCFRLNGGPGQLESKGTWGDFVLQARCRTDSPGTNSGIFFRSIPGSDVMGYESQIDNRRKSAGDDTPVEAGTGAIFRQTVARRVVANDGEWFTKTIAVCGPHVSVWVNGFQVTDWSDTRTPDENPRRGLRLEPGSIMLQAHDPETAISFQRLDIAELKTRRNQNPE